MNVSVRAAFLTVSILALTPDALLAYGGSGNVLSGIGAFLAAVSALLAALFGVIWFPLKRLYKPVAEEEGSTETKEGHLD